MELAGLIVLAYFIGSIPFGVIFAKMKGVDIMAIGSGNTGATNVTRVLGWRIGIVVFILDILKGVVPAALAKYVVDTGAIPAAALPKFLSNGEDIALIVGVFAIVGHMLSPFLKFKGGKGVSTSAGALVGSVPIIGAVTFGVFFLLFFITRIVSLSALITALAILTSGIVLGKSWVFFIVYGPLILYVFIRHKDNIGRIFRGEEPKLDFKSKLKKSEEEENAGD